MRIIVVCALAKFSLYGTHNTYAYNNNYINIYYVLLMCARVCTFYPKAIMKAYNLQKT